MTFPEVTLEFCHVPQSPDYSRALEIAKSLPSYAEEGSGKQRRYRVRLEAQEADRWVALYRLVENWKSSRVYSQGIVAQCKRNSGAFTCFLERLKAADPDGFCYEGNWIGCIRVAQGRSLWFHEGKFEGTDRFLPDKQHIMGSVAASLQHYGLCPAYDQARIFTEIDRLPDTILFAPDSAWSIAYGPGFGPGASRVLGVAFRASRAAPELAPLQEVTAFPWEHKILVVPSSEWAEAARIGALAPLTELGKLGWQVVAVIALAHETHCVLQRPAQHNAPFV